MSLMPYSNYTCSSNFGSPIASYEPHRNVDFLYKDTAGLNLTFFNPHLTRQLTSFSLTGRVKQFIGSLYQNVWSAVSSVWNALGTFPSLPGAYAQKMKFNIKTFLEENVNDEHIHVSNEIQFLYEDLENYYSKAEREAKEFIEVINLCYEDIVWFDLFLDKTIQRLKSKPIKKSLDFKIFYPKFQDFKFLNRGKITKNGRKLSISDEDIKHIKEHSIGNKIEEQLLRILNSIPLPEFEESDLFLKQDASDETKLQLNMFKNQIDLTQWEIVQKAFHLLEQEEIRINARVEEVNELYRELYA